ncbi:hypothetical protein BGZ54_000466 [Gamsiella multidivaricata]|nr:hypothetical protein BGZ54_000466 [Gamsiella multidivaricata]
MSPSAGVDAAPAKNIPAPNNLAKAMSFSLSETSALPLQLQIEAQVAGKQQLAYLPTTGPSLDFYYLNYRPTYIASESKIDFWMLTPKDTPAPKTASLELYDEYGKIHLVTLVPEGTEIPQAIANKNEPFLWKSWAIPKTLKADFDFSEKFRVVLKTSDSKPAHAVVNNINKRFDSIFELLARAKNKHIPTGDNANALMSFTSPDDRAAVAQDRQFHIRGLKATPGGKSNPAKLRVNSVAPAASQVSGVSTAMAGVSSQGVSSNGSDIITITPLLNKYNGEKKASAVAPTNTNSQTFVTLAAMVVALLLAL